MKSQNNVQRQNTKAIQHGNVCPVCKGTGKALQRAFGRDFPNIYVTASMEIQPLVIPCKSCKGFKTDNLVNTGIPQNMMECDLNKFNFGCYEKDLSKIESVAESFINNYAFWKEKGKGFYLWSKTPGSGKTFLACCIARSAMLVNNLSVRFITAPDYMVKVSDSYKMERGENSPIQPYFDCDILILDDIGTQLNKDWQNQELFRLINKRAQEGLITIYTSNSPLEELNASERIISRIHANSIIIQMPEESIRTRQYEKENNDFINAILQGKT